MKYVNYPPPHPSRKNFDIERFTGVRPFPLDDWTDDPETPNVTFVWRDDRHWSSVPNTTVALNWLGSKTRWWLVENKFTKRAGSVLDILGRAVQRRRVVTLAENLYERFSEISVTVVGIGNAPSFPDWIDVDVISRPDPEDERRLCRVYADSHVVVGVHGSNMLLPSAHAATVVDLTADRRWGNLTQDLLLRDVDLPQTLFHYHLLPLDADPDTVTEVVTASLTNRKAYD